MGTDRPPILWSLMQGLYYPAVLGTGIWYFVQKVVVATDAGVFFSDFSNYFAVLVFLCFSISYAVNQVIHPAHYSSVSFLIDVCEILLVFVALYQLGLFKPTQTAANLKHFYWSLAPIPALQRAWNWSI